MRARDDGFLVETNAAPLDLLVRLSPGSREAMGGHDLRVQPLEAW
jgi:hypothetical protein